MSFFPPLTRQKYGWPEASQLRGRHHASMVSSSRSPTRLGCRLREQRERGRRWPWLNGTRRPGSGRAAVCTQVMSYKKRERGECYATMSLAVAAVCLLVSPSGAAETGPQRILFCRMDGWSRRRGHSDDLECPRAGWKWWGGMLSTTVAVVKGDRAMGRRVGRGARSRCYRAPLAEECIFAALSRISGSGAGTIK